MSDVLKRGIANAEVAAVQRTLVMAGFDVPIDELRDDRFGPGTEAAIETFQRKNGLPVTGAVDPATAAALGVRQASATVAGIVSHPDGSPIRGASVAVLRGTTIVAETRADPDGKFTLTVPADAGELEIRADGGTPRALPSARDAWLRLTPTGEYRGPTRFAMLTAVSPAISRAAHSIAEVAPLRAAGINARDAAQLVLAHRLADAASVPPEVFFGLLSQRVPASLAVAFDDEPPTAFDQAQIDHALGQVLMLRPDNVQAALEAAIATHAIPAVDVAAMTAKLQTLRIDYVASQPYRVGKTPFRDVLATTLPPPSIRAVVEAYAEHGTTAAFWAKLEQAHGFDAQQRADLRFTLKTSVLVRGHLPLLEHARKQRATGAIASPADLARREAADWGAVLREVDPRGEQLTFIANLRFDTVDQRIDHFAQLLAAQFERRYPTAALAGRLAKHGRELPLTSTTGVGEFLDRNRTFSIRRTHIDAYVKSTGVVPAEVVSDLKRVQRLYKLTRRFDHVRAMLVNGHASAQSVYAAGRTRFVTTMATAGVSKRAARSIFARAESAHATTLALLGNFNTAMTRVAPAAVAQPLPAMARSALLAGFPDLQSLFGATDYCSCEHCRSIHGPAAYLVDILQFLRHRAAATGTARDVLFARRRDLAATELSCANTNGVVPYIDLACEVFEDAVSEATPQQVRARQTTGSPEERRANPQFVNEAAYAVLRDAVFPHTVPFDLWAVEVRAFLRQLGVPWHGLLRAFQSAGVPSETEIAGEYLGFDRRGLAAVTTSAPVAPWTHWGLVETGNSVPDPRTPDDPSTVVTGTWLDVLGAAPIFLHRADVTHRELVQLLATRFINPSGAIRIVESSSDGLAHCDTGTQTITTWTADALSRFERFVRLWRRLGCTIWDLDKALCDPRVGNAATDEAAIAQLARLVELSTSLALPWDELLGLWSPIDRFSYTDVLGDGERILPSVYERRFRNATVLESTTVFVEDPMALSGQLGSAEAVAGISAALGIANENIQRIRVAAGLAAPTTALDLPNLSVVFRYAVLARALGIAVAELVAAIAVTGIDPFAGPVQTHSLVAALDQVRASGFSVLELDYLLRHGSPLPALDAGIAITDSTIAGWLEDLRQALVRVGGDDEDHVVQRISDLVALDPNLTRELMSQSLAGATVSLAVLLRDPRLTQRAADGSFVVRSERAGFASLFDAFVVLGKLRVILTRWRVSARDARWLLAHASEVGWLALQTLPATAAGAIAFAPFVALRRVVAMQQNLVGAEELRLFDIALQRTAARDDVARMLAALCGWDPADAIAIADHFGWTTGAALVAADTAPRIAELAKWHRRLGADVATTLSFVTTVATPALAHQARQLTKAKYDLATWYAVASAVQDGLRDRKRAALVAWLVANPAAPRGQHWTSVEELYGFYLIDPEMSAVASTTRIKQAAASVQLFVQRCLLQREPDVSVDAAADSGWREWAWMKRFRLWEANRKIFLYPENWIDPSQRRAKSSFFVELENSLQQSAVTHDAAEDAVLDYLHKLADVSNLEISGMCQQLDYGQRLLHVIARTRKTPHVHYYRRLGSTGVWSPWEKLDVEIDGDHVLPVYWNRRLHVFWPQFEQKSLPSSSADRSVPVGGGGVSPAPAQYWEIGLAWVEKRRDRWLQQRTSMRKQIAFDQRARYFAVKAPTLGRQLAVDLYASRTHYAQWQLATSDAQPVGLHTGLTPALSGLEEAMQLGVLAPAQRKPPLISSMTTTWSYNALTGGAPGVTSKLALLEGSPQQDLVVLQKIAQPRVMADHQPLQFTSQSPFFLSDPKRTFYVEPSFVSTQVYSRWQPSGAATFTTQYAPTIFYHPYIDTFLQELAYGGVDALYSRRLQLDPDGVRGLPAFDFAAEYQPTAAVRQRPAPEPAYPVETIDYSHDGAYAAYNWELFFHIPFLVAKRLADNQRFDEALRWFHYIFDPNATTGRTAPQRYWVPRVFHDLSADDYARQQVEKLLQLVNQGDPELAQKIAEWRADPFDPHLIAASRPVAYQKAIVMQYIETLIAWGDQLFRGDTIETINEATQLYLLASQLLGPRPQNLRALEPSVAKTYDELAPTLDAFGNAVVEIENVISIPPPGSGPNGAPLPQLHTFYFCIPPNEKLLSFWDIVADRLFKIRQGLDIEGVARPLALYEPPIDPGLLVRAAAAGVEIGSAIADIDVDRPCYRFRVMWQVAHDLCEDVRSLGSAIVGALERRDAEQLARLQSTQELALLGAVRAIKQDQLTEAKATRDALIATRAMTTTRRNYYATREFANAAELSGLVLGGGAAATQAAATLLDLFAAASYTLPSITFGGAGFGGSPVATVTTGGQTIGNGAAMAANALRSIAATLNQGANLATTVGNYQRRRDDWDLERRVADKELVQIDRQLLAAEVRIALCQHDLDAHDRQTDHSATVAEQLATRFTRQELYDWSVSQLSTTYFQAYQLAYDLAKRASKAYAYELGVDPGYIQFGYWDSLHKGLHAGDKLLLDLRRLQAEYLRRNVRELELTKHVSLLQLDPTALVRLRQTGACFITLPESMFDLDQPGHYLRRLKRVAVTLPCVTGPYTTVNATLTLVGDSVRIASEPGAQYAPAVDGDGLPIASDQRFARSAGLTQSIALSTGREDNGMFELTFDDDRYLPFEGRGAISRWRLELPLDTNAFDVATLSDVVLHLAYTARDGGAALRDAARAAVVAALPRTGQVLVSARTEFPDAWARFWAPRDDGQGLTLALDPRHFPHRGPRFRYQITAAAALLVLRDERMYADYAAATPLRVHFGFATADGSPPTTTSAFTPDPGLGQLPVAGQALGGPVGPLALAFAEPDLAAVPLLAVQETSPDGSVHTRLVRERIDDVLVLISYRLEQAP